MNRLSEITTEQREAVCAAYAIKLLDNQEQAAGFDKLLNLLVDALMFLDDEQLTDDMKMYIGDAGNREVWAKAEEWTGPF